MELIIQMILLRDQNNRIFPKIFPSFYSLPHFLEHIVSKSLSYLVGMHYQLFYVFNV